MATDVQDAPKDKDPTKIEVEKDVETLVPPQEGDQGSATSVTGDLMDPTTKPCYGISPSFLLDKNTMSFRCLTQKLMSRSSLLRNPLYFPRLVDDGSIEAAFNYVAPEPVYDEVGVTKYQTQCKELGIVPMSRVINSLNQDVLDLRYHGLTLKQMRAITSALKINTYIKTLHLQDNWMTPEQSSLIGDMLTENSSITYLNLRECRIGPEGAPRINEGLMMTQFVRKLDLSFNSLGNEGLAAILTGLSENTSIDTLDLSHNNLDEGCAFTLEKILQTNSKLQNLDLSWNCFNTGAGNKAIFRGLTNNPNIRGLNLSWNGIHVRPAMMPISRYLKKTNVIEELDLSSNRLTGKSFTPLKAAIAKNRSLLKVKVGNNPVTIDNALSLANTFANKVELPMQHLDMENIFLTKAFLPARQRINQMGKKITIGGILSNYTIHGPNLSKLVFERCKYLASKPKRKKAKRDFGHFILSLPEKNVTRADFETLLKKFKAKKLDKDLITELENRFTAKGKKVDVVSMRTAYMCLYPDTRLPPPPPKKQKKKKGKGKKGKGKKSAEQKMTSATAVAEAAKREQMMKSVSFAEIGAKPDGDTNTIDNEPVLRDKVSQILYQTVSGNIQRASAILQEAIQEYPEESSAIVKQASFIMRQAISGEVLEEPPNDEEQEIIS